MTVVFHLTELDYAANPSIGECTRCIQADQNAKKRENMSIFIISDICWDQDG